MRISFEVVVSMVKWYCQNRHYTVPGAVLEKAQQFAMAVTHNEWRHQISTVQIEHLETLAGNRMEKDDF